MKKLVVAMWMLSWAVAAGLAAPAAARDGDAVDFERDIQPIFEEHCYRCHGPEKQKSGFRLDVKTEALLGGDSGRVIVPGDSAASLLYEFVSGMNPDTTMPPKGDPLTAAELDLIKRWIDQGADWPTDGAVPNTTAITPEHWSFQPIQDAPVPRVGREDWVRNPIDSFVLAKLEKEGIAPSPEADPVTLIRRLSLDLVGLPPTPGEVDDFVNDSSPYAYQRLVNRLLASPHYGERWGRHWLDLARYADSDGFEKDTVRPHAWRYRQWLIDALNRDLPYDQFVIEQLAGDLLPGATLDQKVATGFHRNTLTNREGGVDQEEYRVEQIVDRVNTTASVFMGLTMACAQCHTHKYDPLTHREYYGMFAFFNKAMEKDILAPLDAELALHARALAAFEKRHAAIRASINKYKPELEKKSAAWEARLGEFDPQELWTMLEPASMLSAGGATLDKLDDGSILASGNNPEIDTYTVVVNTQLEGITGIRLEALPDSSLPNNGPGRAEKGGFVLTEFTLQTARLSGPETKEAIQLEDARPGNSGGIENAIDGSQKTGWSVGGKRKASAVFVAEAPFGHADGSVLSFRIEQRKKGPNNLGRFRLSVTTAPREHLAIPPALYSVLAKRPKDRTPEEKAELLDFHGAIDPKMRELQAAVDAHARSRPTLEETKAQTIVENPEPPKTHIHLRGNFMNKGAEVQAHTPAVLPPFDARGETPDRLDLARWLMRPEHPLTSRVAANRVWEHLFGQGLVLTSEDFGTRGELPSHPELLDWLAHAYMARGWSSKEMIKLIVSSATYRQSSRVRPELAVRDPGNALLARQNRFRVEAEAIRDLFLASSGLLNPTVGGPSIRPPLPEGMKELGYNNSIKWPESQGAGKYRRGIYILFQRTVPYPMLITFDCPDSNVTAVRRSRSNTPLQALTLMNDPVFFECAQALGRRICTEAGESAEDRIRHAFRLCLAREPAERELSKLAALWKTEHETFKEDAALAREVVGGEPPEGVALAQAASWVLLGRTILNLDEFVTRE